MFLWLPPLGGRLSDRCDVIRTDVADAALEAVVNVWFVEILQQRAPSADQCLPIKNHPLELFFVLLSPRRLLLHLHLTLVVPNLFALEPGLRAAKSRGDEVAVRPSI